MKDKDKEFILRLCKDKFEGSERKAAQANVMLRNIKPIKDAMVEAGKPFDKVPFELVESTIKKITKKYRITFPHIVVVTDVKGNMQFSTGIVGIKTGSKQKDQSEHLVTLHGSTMYELMVKVLLTMFVIVKSNVVLERGEFDFKNGGWKNA